MKFNNKTALLFSILLLGLILRLYHINGREVWYDEAFGAKLTTHSYGEMVELSESDVHPPLYYLLLKSWTSIFGDSPLSLRFPSVLFGLSTCLISFFLVRYITSDEKKGYWALLILAVNPFLVLYSMEARSYTLVSFLTVLSVLSLFIALREQRYWPITIILPFLTLTHYVTVFGSIILVVILLIKSKRSSLYIVPWAASLTYALPLIMQRPQSAELDWIPQFSVSRLVESIHAFLLGVDINRTGVNTPLNPFPIEGIVLSYVIVLILIIMIGFSRKFTKDDFVLFACGAVPILLVALTSVLFDKHAYLERYLIGYAVVLLVTWVITQRKQFVFIPYVLLSVYVVLSFNVVNGGYRVLRNYTSTRPLVFADATEYITAKYYSKNVWLQDGDWEEWAIITDNDIWYKAKARNDFYIVSKQGIKGWIPIAHLGVFNLYAWDVE